MPWPSRIGLSLAVFAGGFGFVTAALAAAVGHHEALHAELCHEVGHFTAAESVVRATLNLIGLHLA